MRSFFLGLVFPALCLGGIAYFGYYTVCGPRGLLELYDAKARLSVQQEQLAALTADRTRLQHRISLLSGPNPDRDLIEEVARAQMIGSEPGQVAVPRKLH